jgi:hypothetical protein
MDQPSRQEIDVFTSLQCHINKEYPTQAPFIQVDTINAFSSMSREIGLHLEGSPRLVCVCGDRATHLFNFLGKEALYCQRHAERARVKYESVDRLAWFCRELIRDKPTADSYYIKVWKVPRELREKYGGLPWLWFTDGDCFTIYHSRPDASHLPANVRVEKILKSEMRKLLNQLSEEIRQKRPICVIGFTFDHPFDRPDLSIGYSIGMHMCNECSDQHFEAYCFRFATTDVVFLEITEGDDIVIKPQTSEIVGKKPSDQLPSV